ncbi:L-2-amino-thiazoline-4-carboxylic acid hydrolase [Clostridium tetani]|uniref:L-2-amino-thiazoline-4-carboxylic acid hydrolase n=1 Tax=Clostridium tetani TaxID=1513 RepID=UPI0005140B8B|nr:L-2-amino-thiazoline-4-carboxylic acid hydrolase [Clostridium tetani]KGI43313.1 hypothetical protein KY55_07670 [Clostridium tetani]RXI45619.1 hypothetical protein DP126_08760 [Clostridium tetani]RXI51577.1 hypothetical protein DP122_11410 [Clostridium tetani]RXI56230.1 hypothetical protein DP124_00880 [Clostridium tetani]RXI69754.1 hypothetical protein DP127_10575 [Clostridium tetani]
MEYTNSCKLYWFVFKRILKKEISKRYSKRYTNDLLKKTKKEYKALILRAPHIGGKENKLANNIYMGGVFIACYKAANKKITPEEMGEIISEGLNNSKIIKLACKNKSQTSNKYKKWIKDVSKWSQENANKYPTNWIMREDKEKHKIGTYFEFTRCALCELCKMEGCPEVTPQLCKTDFITANFGESKLIRTSILADGASCCDFWFIEKDQDFKDDN